VIRKLLEAFFRYKFILLLPPLVIPAIVGPVAFMSSPPQYEAATSVWVDKPAYLNYQDNNAFGTAVQSQAGRLNELLHTRAFVMDVAQRTSLAPLVGTPSGETRIADTISKGVTIGGPGNVAGSEHLLLIHVQAATAQLAYELCQALLDAYQEKTAADQSDQASVAVQFYQSRVQQTQQQLEQANQSLRRYVLAYQVQSGTAVQGDPSQQLTLPSVVLDPKLGDLQTGVSKAQSDYNNAVSSLTQAQQNASASVQGQQLGFQVLDPPTRATAPVSQLKKVIMYPIVAAVVGLGLSGMLLVLLVAADRSVRAGSDLALGVRMLGSVPALKLKKTPKQLRSVAARRAVGAPAGTALPAPAGAK
jgi:uncharacterized protein involved in exopolysaccharide biosynthesis